MPIRMGTKGTPQVKRRRHTPEQITRKLREADRLLAEGKPTSEVARHLEISEQTFHRWRNQYGGMKADDAKRLKELENEIRQLYKGSTGCQFNWQNHRNTACSILIPETYRLRPDNAAAEFSCESKVAEDQPLR